VRKLKSYHLLAGIALTMLCLVDPSITDGAALPGSVEGTIQITRTGKAAGTQANIVVYLKRVRETRRDDRKHVIRQRDLQFSPRISAVVKGTTVDFPNDDKVFHNVFSASRPARFDLGLYRSGGSKSVEFRREGVVDIFCNIHPEMSSRVLVVPNHHFTLTDKTGKFRLDGVPAGTYPIVAWHAHGGETRGTVTIEPGKAAKVQLQVEEREKPAQHRRKDGTPYGRYE
jgi:plastocyanin